MLEVVVIVLLVLEKKEKKKTAQKDRNIQLDVYKRQPVDIIQMPKAAVTYI